jgi:hypothetical protein
MKNQLELLSLRNRNLKELNKKYECSDMFSQMPSPTVKSTAIETERYRHQAQQLELANMELRHKLEEAKAQKLQSVKQVETMKARA